MSGKEKQLTRTLAALTLSAPLALTVGPTDAWSETVLRVVPHADLANIDPIWTTAYITRNHGYMVYDTLFATDENFEVQPQMVGEWAVSDDGLTYTFTLRDGLTFHDGEPVTAEDVVASIERWGARDVMGQKLMDFTESLRSEDEKTVELVLKEPYGLVLESLGKISSNVPFIMPARLAATDPYEQVPEIIGSGPFRFVQEEWVPGSRVVYERFEDYVPRAEPPSSAAGGKVAKVDRIEWLIIPDAQTASSALTAGEVDYYEQPPVDLVPVLEVTEGIRIEVLDPLGTQGWLRMNHLHPPFDNVKARQALLHLMDQEAYLRAMIGDPRYYELCKAYFICGTPYETDVGTGEVMDGEREKARQLLEEAGYDGRPVVVLHPTDSVILNPATLVTAQALREIGVNVELQAMDWATLTSRRAMREPPEQGGWNIFHTWSIGPDVANPVANSGIGGGCERAWFGWPCDEGLEELRDAFARTTDEAERKRIVDELQLRAFEVVPYVSYGQWYGPVAYREELSGVITAPVPFFWNIEKEEQG